MPARPQPLPPFDFELLLEDPPLLIRRLVLAFALERPKLLRPARRGQPQPRAGAGAPPATSAKP